MRPAWLGLDIGSGSARALLLDASGRARLVARRPLRARCDSPLRTVYDPEAVLRAAGACLREGVRRGRGAVRAFGLSAQRSTYLVWRRSDGRPLTPAWGWQSRDGAPPPSARAARQVALLSGLRWSPHYAGPRAARLLAARPGLRRELQAGRACLGTLDTWLIFRWSGGREFRTDPTHAQRTLLFNPFRGGWDPRLLRLFGVPRPGLPRVLPSALFSLGLGRGLPALRASLGDQQAALAAARLAAPGACLVNYGTGAFVLAGASRAVRRPPRGLLLAEAVDPAGRPRRALEAPLPTAAAALGLLRPGARGSAVSSPAATPPLLVAATHGLGAPWWLEQVPSLLLFQAPPDAQQAEAAAEFSIAASVQAAIDQLPAPPERIVATGGLAARDRLMSLQATLAGRGVWRPRFREWSALGAALLAAGPDRPPLAPLETDRFSPLPPLAAREARSRYALWVQGARFLARIGRQTSA